MGVQSKPTQNERILDYISEFGSITQIEALRDLGVMRLASRISDLKRKGYTVISTREVVKNRYGESVKIKRYSLGEKYESKNTETLSGPSSKTARGH